MGLKGFVEGGIASIAAGASTHPLDLIKVRMQLSGEFSTAVAYSLRPAAAGVAAVVIPPPRVGPISMGLHILEAEGAAALFSGISATIIRQTLYYTARVGLDEALVTKWTDPETRTIPLGRKLAAGLVADGVGAAVGNPADVSMVQMQADGRLPPAEHRN